MKNRNITTLFMVTYIRLNRTIQENFKLKKNIY